MNQTSSWNWQNKVDQLQHLFDSNKHSCNARCKCNPATDIEFDVKKVIDSCASTSTFVKAVIYIFHFKFLI